MSRSEWAREIEIADYDLAWSMIHFLVHGDDGRYVRPLSGFINDVGRGTRYEQAWLKHFGRDIDAFHARWRSYWLDQPADPTRTGRLQAVAATLTSFLARATSRRQRFADFADFFQAGRAGRLQARPQDWLPPGLLAEALDQAEARGAWSLEQPPRAMPRLCCRSEDGAELTGWFALRDGRVARVAVEVRHEPAPASTATAPGKDRR